MIWDMIHIWLELIKSPLIDLGIAVSITAVVVGDRI